VELNDLPNEILLIIFKKLGNLEVLYSFQGVNEQLNEIIHDPLFTSCLSFPQLSFKKYIKKFSSDIIFNRFCSQILHAIRTKIKWLDLESESMRNILDAADYPNLYALDLYNIEEETDKNERYLTFYDAAYRNNVRLLFDVCIYILDGRFEQLHTLDIELANIFPPFEEIESQGRL
ncbi:unnamed protein product, partial [Rotaria magnacalcarata]